MTNNTEVTVTQADIRAAADFMDECNPYLGDCGMKNSVHLAVRQAFAQHRTRSVGEAKPPLKMLVDDEWLQKRIDEDEAGREGEAVRLMRAYYAAEAARNDCPECKNEGQWEHCEPCSERIGNAINDQLLFLATSPKPNDSVDAVREAIARAIYEADPVLDQETDCDYRASGKSYQLTWEQVCENSPLAHEHYTSLADAALSAWPSLQTQPAARDVVEALVVAERHKAKWLKRSLKHARANGLRSDYQIRDLERARICDDIAKDIAALSQPAGEGL